MPGRTLWVDTMVDFDVANAAQVRFGMTAEFTAAQTRLEAMTLLRTIVRLDLAYVTHDSAEGSQKVSLGIGVASQEALAAGVVADPEAAADFPTRGWVWRGVYRVFGFAAGIADVHVRPIDLDLRSKRRLENGDAFFVITNEAQDGATSAINVLGVIRQLWLVT